VSGEQKPVYVIGTEVPFGGATESLTELAVTSREAAAETLAVHRRVFKEAGLAHVWPRVIAVVVQPELNSTMTVWSDYDLRARASHRTAKRGRRAVYEAHSTDYQRPEPIAFSGATGLPS